ncbi:DUF551 domain-containing protein [Aureimonas sp. ME7]|uniref:DUF551 domain-containing protein n=1 Tax=Aureimonas sp. ME7 TaxID=2744252 RepID=UPI0015FA5083|nr:DUF551 domain-containing protein [Aureimonas sp. ME7]
MADNVQSDVPVLFVDELAQEIRRVDGSHSLGAGALAEALMPFLADRASNAGRDAVLEEADGWRPIETAPRDGTNVIVAVPTKDRDDFIVGEAYCNEERGGWWWANLSDGDYYASPIIEMHYHLPSHWRPLPAPPALSSSSTGEREDG